MRTIGLGVASLALVVGLAACGGNTASPTTTATTTTTAAPTTTAAAATTTTTTTPAVGAGQTLIVGTGDKVIMYVVKVTDPAAPDNSFDAAPAGQHLVGVMIKVRGVSGTSTSDANNTVVSGSNGQTYQFSFSGLAGCTNFNGGDFTVTPGESQVGCVAFAVPNGVKITQVSYVAPVGMGETSAIWKVG